MAPTTTDVVRSRRSDGGNGSAGGVSADSQQQPHLRWQVLVIFTIFVTTIRFYVLGNKSEVLIYCVCGLILLMAALLLSLCSLKKNLSTTSSPNRYNAYQHQRNGSGNSSNSATRRNRQQHHQHYYHHQYHHPQQQYQLDNPDEYSQQNSVNEASILDGYRGSDFIGYGIDMNDTGHNYNHFYSLIDSQQQTLQQQQPLIHHSQQNNQLLAAATAAPPPYHIAILLPPETVTNPSASTGMAANNNKDINVEFDENAPPPSYDKIAKTS